MVTRKLLFNNKTLKLIVCLFLININSAGAQWIMQVLHPFNGNDGAISKGSLTLAGNVLYGRTSAGGSSGKGVIFSITTDSTHFFQVLYNFPSGSNNQRR